MLRNYNNYNTNYIINKKWSDYIKKSNKNSIEKMVKTKTIPKTNLTTIPITNDAFTKFNLYYI
jgi:hypothetical protein